MELKELVGEHVLSGVDMSSKSIQQWGDHYEDCQVINFVLDGKTYTAIEDPEDGYRSCMSEIKESDEPVSNVFEGQRVLAKMRDDDRYETNDVLELVDLQTGKVVLSVGTGNTDDYYPYWVAEFTPENMGINTGSNNRLHNNRATPEGKQAELFNINSGKQSPENKTPGM